MIAYLGTGLLGSGFVRKLLERGETVRVWNRTPEKALALAGEGAVVCATAAEAVRGADQIHLTLADDDSVDAVLEPLAGTIGASTLILDHTTTAPTPTGERVARWKQRGVTFVHTPVFMGPAAARNAQGFMLLSGAPDVRVTVTPLIAPMTGKVIDLGDDPTRAAAFKLFGNMMLVFIVTGLADGYRFAESLGIPAIEAQRLFDDFKPGATFELRGKAMASGDYTPQWELAMARKDVRLMLEEAQRHGTSLAVLPAIAGFFDTYVQAGLGGEDVGVVARRDVP
jgi:3-hydroxyisobutyrate dehydrogenase